MNTAIGPLRDVRAAIFDFNGTITDDEELQYEIFADIFRDNLRVDLDPQTYFTELAGMSDLGIVERALEIYDRAPSASTRDRLVEQRLISYRDRVAHSPPVRPGTAQLIRRLRQRIPLAVATGALRNEVEFVLSASGLLDCFTAIVTIEDVNFGKPDPEGFNRALARLNAAQPPGQSLHPRGVVVFEDSPFGVAAARSAGMRCVAAHTTADGVDADLVVNALTPTLIAAVSDDEDP